MATVLEEAAVFLPEVLFLAVFAFAVLTAGACEVFFFAAVLLVVFLLLVLVLVICLCTADGRACSDAWANGVKVKEVKNRAQSVSETLFIRATERSPELS